MFRHQSALMLIISMVLAPLSLAFADEQVRPVAYHIEKRQFFSMSYFNAVDALGTLSTTVRHYFSPFFWAKYSVADADGNETGTIEARWLNSSSFFPSSADLDVHDVSGQLIGMLRGHFFTVAPARFSLYSATGQLIADASIDNRVRDCLFTDPRNVGRTYAAIKRRADIRSNNLGSWDAVVEQPDVVDPRMVHALAVYLADYENFIGMNPPAPVQTVRVQPR